MSALTFQSRIMAKIATQILGGSGSTNSPEPEEIKEAGIRVYKPQLTPSNGLRSEKPIRRPNGPNRTFHRYCSELWAIKATRTSRCPYCKQPIIPGDEISLFEKVHGWAHLSHAVNQEATMPENVRL
jgi:hypothetical protein